MAQDADARLLDSARAGDRQAMGELLTRHQRLLYNVILRMVRHREDAAELTQQAMVKIIEHLPEFRGESAVSTWMTRIAINAALAHQRQAGRRGRPVSLDAPAEANGEARTSLGAGLADAREPSPARGVELEEARTRIEAALGELEPDFRAVVVLRDVGEMDYAAIAEVLEVPVGTVKSRLFRARLALREHLSASEREPADEVRDE